MVDSETQTTDDLLEDLLIEKLKQAYEERQMEQEKMRPRKTTAKSM